MKKTIDYEKYEGKEFEGLSEFYKDLGWNPETHIVQPKHLKVSQTTWSKLLDVLFVERTIQQNFTYMNYGPSVDDQVPNDKILIENGWLIA